jgi:hypothetical protein
MGKKRGKKEKGEGGERREGGKVIQEMKEGGEEKRT